MKREELRELGLSDEAVQAIMTMHGKTVTDLKGQIEELTNERDVATSNINKYQEELTALKEGARDNEELTAKLQDLHWVI
ncbi:phage scaffolding protein [Streptococcaceae bacterium ESL0729]|nr:phage scaffolding protein [Streptococcaceae bacterium ESL0729]